MGWAGNLSHDGGRILKGSGEAVIVVMENSLLISSEEKEGNASVRPHGLFWGVIYF